MSFSYKTYVHIQSSLIHSDALIPREIFWINNIKLWIQLTKDNHTNI